MRPCLLPKLLSIAIAAVDVLLSSPAEASKERRGIKQPLAPPSGPFLLLFGLAQRTTSSAFAEEVEGDQVQPTASLLRLPCQTPEEEE